MSDTTKQDLPFIKLYTGDYRRLTVALSPAEKGAFMQLFVYFWDTGKPTPDRDSLLAQIVGCSVRDWKEMKPNLIEARFEVRDGMWRHPFFEYHREKTAADHAKNVERARNAANARYQKGGA